MSRPIRDTGPFQPTASNLPLTDLRGTLTGDDMRIVNSVFGMPVDEALMVWGAKVKGSNLEKRLVVVTEYQLGQFKCNKAGALTEGKCSRLLDLKKITISNASGLLLKFAERILEFQPNATVSPEDLFHHLIFASMRLMIGAPTKLQVVGVDGSTLKVLDPVLPFGGFAPCYLAQLQLLDPTLILPDAAAIAKHITDTGTDIGTLHPQDSIQARTLALENLPGVKTAERRFAPIGLQAAFQAMYYNTFFFCLSLRGPASGLPMSTILPEYPEVTASFVAMCQSNTTLQQLNLRGIGLPNPTWMEVGKALELNTACQLMKLDLSNNRIKAAGAAALVAVLKKLRLHQINLSNCKLAPKGCASILNAMRSNLDITGTLHTVDMSQNAFQTSGTAELIRWLTMSPPVALNTLILQDASIDTSAIFKSVSFRNLSRLRHFDMSGNAILVKASTAMEEFLGQSSLAFFGVARCKLNATMVLKVLQSMASNTNRPVWSVDTCSNAVGEAGATALEEFFNREVLPMRGMILGDMGIPAASFPKLFRVFDKMSLVKLDLSGNIKHSDVNMYPIMESLATLLQSVSIRELRMAGNERCYLGNHIIPLLKSISFTRNSTLHTLDVSANNYGDAGATTLANFLRENTSLTHIDCDQNNITMEGLRELASSVASSQTILNFIIEDDVRGVADYAKKQKDVKMTEQLRECVTNINTTVRRNLKSSRAVSNLRISQAEEPRLGSLIDFSGFDVGATLPPIGSVAQQFGGLQSGVGNGGYPSGGVFTAAPNPVAPAPAPGPAPSVVPAPNPITPSTYAMSIPPNGTFGTMEGTPTIPQPFSMEANRQRELDLDPLQLGTTPKRGRLRTLDEADSIIRAIMNGDEPEETEDDLDALNTLDKERLMDSEMRRALRSFMESGDKQNTRPVTAAFIDPPPGLPESVTMNGMNGLNMFEPGGIPSATRPAPPVTKTNGSNYNNGMMGSTLTFPETTVRPGHSNSNASTKPMESTRSSRSGSLASTARFDGGYDLSDQEVVARLDSFLSPAPSVTAPVPGDIPVTAQSVKVVAASNSEPRDPSRRLSYRSPLAAGVEPAPGKPERRPSAARRSRAPIPVSHRRSTTGGGLKPLRISMGPGGAVVGSAADPGIERTQESAAAAEPAAPPLMARRRIGTVTRLINSTTIPKVGQPPPLPATAAAPVSTSPANSPPAPTPTTATTTTTTTATTDATLQLPGAEGPVPALPPRRTMAASRASRAAKRKSVRRSRTMVTPLALRTTPGRTSLAGMDGTLGVVSPPEPGAKGDSPPSRSATAPLPATNAATLAMPATTTTTTAEPSGTSGGRRAGTVESFGTEPAKTRRPPVLSSFGGAGLLPQTPTAFATEAMLPPAANSTAAPLPSTPNGPRPASPVAPADPGRRTGPSDSTGAKASPAATTDSVRRTEQSGSSGAKPVASSPMVPAATTPAPVSSVTASAPAPVVPERATSPKRTAARATATSDTAPARSDPVIMPSVVATETSTSTNGPPALPVRKSSYAGQRSGRAVPEPGADGAPPQSPRNGAGHQRTPSDVAGTTPPPSMTMAVNEDGPAPLPPARKRAA